MPPFAIQPKLFVVLITLVAVTALSSIYYYTHDRQLELRVKGMHCDGCVGSVKKSLEKMPGVKSVKIVFPYDELASPECACHNTAPGTETPTPDMPPKEEIGQVQIVFDYLHNPTEAELQKAVNLAGDYQVKLVQK